jgi:hypothetical protein
VRNADSELGSKPTRPNPRRVAAGKLNRAKRKGLTPEGRERLRQAALRNRPWRFSTGPQTTAGKAAAARNGERRRDGLLSVRELKAELAALRGLARQMGDARSLVADALGT